MKTVIYGGSFDPVHSGHIGIVRHLCERFDRVIVLPTGDAPHKKISSAEDRFAMLRLCLQDVEISTYEIEAGQTSYTYLSVEHFCRELGDITLCIGGDSLLDFLSWKKPDKILERVGLYVVPRPDQSASLSQSAQYLRSMYGARVELSDYTGENISSSELRIRAAFGDYSRLPSEIIGYVREKGLYRIPEAERLGEFGLSQSRIDHTMRTAIMAQRLAKRNFCDPSKAVLAAVLHDVGKNTPVDLALSKGYIDKEELNAPLDVIHSFIGAGIAQKEFLVEDVLVVNAIKYHTTGRRGMGLLEKIIFAADYIEEGRDFEGIEAIRQATLDNLGEGIIKILESTIKYLTSCKKDIDKRTIEAYNEIVGDAL